MPHRHTWVDYAYTSTQRHPPGREHCFACGAFRDTPAPNALACTCPECAEVTARSVAVEHIHWPSWHISGPGFGGILDAPRHAPRHSVKVDVG